MPLCLIGLGSNLGDRRANLQFALTRLAALPHIRLVRQSAFHETAPVGGPANQPFYLNSAAVLDTALSPQALLTVLQDIERQAGRRRGERWGERTLDLDLLLYGDCTLDSPELTLPHPRMAWRRFVLEPAAEVAGDMPHPVLGWTIARLREHLDRAIPYLAFAGPIGAGKTALATAFCRHRTSQLLVETVDESGLAAFYANPAVHAWAMELEFLRQRRDLLSVEHPPQDGIWTVSDFWFDQSRAFAAVWLADEQLAAFDVQYHETRRRVIQPKLLVLVDAPAPVLLGRIRRRGRPGESVLSEERLDRLRAALKTQAFHSPDCPVLALDAIDPGEALSEVLAAIEGMG